MRRVDRSPPRFAPIFAVFADANPRIQFTLKQFRRPCLEDIRLRFHPILPCAVWILLIPPNLPCIGRKPRHRKAFATKIHDARVAVVQWCVVDDFWISPRLAVVATFADNGSPPRADMALPQARSDDAKRSIVLLCNAGPTEIAKWFIRKAADDAMDGVANSLRRIFRHTNTYRQRCSHNQRQFSHDFPLIRVFSCLFVVKTTLPGSYKS